MKGSCSSSVPWIISPSCSLRGSSAWSSPIRGEPRLQHARPPADRGYKTDFTYVPSPLRDEIIGVRLHNLTPRMAITSLPFGLYVENDENAHCTVSCGGAWTTT